MNSVDGIENYISGFFKYSCLNWNCCNKDPQAFWLRYIRKIESILRVWSIFCNSE